MWNARLDPSIARVEFGGMFVGLIFASLLLLWCGGGECSIGDDEDDGAVVLELVVVGG